MVPYFTPIPWVRSLHAPDRTHLRRSLQARPLTRALSPSRPSSRPCCARKSDLRTHDRLTMLCRSPEKWQRSCCALSLSLALAGSLARFLLARSRSRSCTLAISHSRTLALLPFLRPLPSLPLSLCLSPFSTFLTHTMRALCLVCHCMPFPCDPTEVTYVTLTAKKTFLVDLSGQRRTEQMLRSQCLRDA